MSRLPGLATTASPTAKQKDGIALEGVLLVRIAVDAVVARGGRVVDEEGLEFVAGRAGGIVDARIPGR